MSLPLKEVGLYEGIWTLYGLDHIYIPGWMNLRELNSLSYVYLGILRSSNLDPGDKEVMLKWAAVT